MNRHNRNIAALKEVIAFFALLACAGSAYNSKWLAAGGYLAVFLLLYYEKKIRQWIRQHLHLS
jgi:hypothetical protein